MTRAYGTNATDDVIDLIIPGKARGESNSLSSPDLLGNFTLHSGDLLLQPTGMVYVTETKYTDRFDNPTYY